MTDPPAPGLRAAVRRLRLSTLAEHGPVEHLVCDGVRGRYNIPYDPDATPETLGWTTIALLMECRDIEVTDDAVISGMIDAVRIELRNAPHPVAVWLTEQDPMPVQVEAWTRTIVGDYFDNVPTKVTVPRFAVRGLDTLIGRSRIHMSVDGGAERFDEWGRYYTVSVAHKPMPAITVGL